MDDLDRLNLKIWLLKSIPVTDIRLVSRDYAHDWCAAGELLADFTGWSLEKSTDSETDKHFYLCIGEYKFGEWTEGSGSTAPEAIARAWLAWMEAEE